MPSTIEVAAAEFSFDVSAGAAATHRGQHEAIFRTREPIGRNHVDAANPVADLAWIDVHIRLHPNPAIGDVPQALS